MNKTNSMLECYNRIVNNLFTKRGAMIQFVPILYEHAVEKANDVVDIVKKNYIPKEYPTANLPFTVLDVYDDYDATTKVKSFTGVKKCDAKGVAYKKMKTRAKTKRG